MAPRLLYIKLGIGSNWAEECFKKGTVKFDFRDIDDEMFLSGNLDSIWEQYVRVGYKNRAASKYSSQINRILTADENTVWITFHNQKMWWCRASKEIFPGKDKTKFKKAIGGWSDCDINGKVLWEDDLSGALVKTKAYRSTLCVPEAVDYALNKIHARQSFETVKFEKNLIALKKSTLALIQNLSPQDFELIVDLIFRNAGFQRLGILGKSNKTIDLSLSHPLTAEKILVQIKSSADLSTYKAWKEEVRIKDSDTKYYFIVHSPGNGLLKYEEPVPERFSLWRQKEISDMVIRFGMIDWLIQKVG